LSKQEVKAICYASSRGINERDTRTLKPPGMFLSNSLKSDLSHTSILYYCADTIVAGDILNHLMNKYRSTNEVMMAGEVVDSTAHRLLNKIQ
jgi:hypothetical protein